MSINLRSGYSYDSSGSVRGSRRPRGSLTSGYGTLPGRDPYVDPYAVSTLRPSSPSAGSTVNEVSDQINNVVAGVDAIKSALDNLTPNSEFERGIQTACS